MQVLLEAIKFNYDPDLKTTGAINLRHNETQIVPIPEWDPAVQSGPEASPAAYVISALPKCMTIQASFNCPQQLKAPVMVQAIVGSQDHVLGRVEAVEIPSQGSSGFVTLHLPDARVAAAGVGISDITWHWQFQEQSGIWTTFQTTNHRIYSVFTQPFDPWDPGSRAAANVFQPWTEILNDACKWAAGTDADLDEAATRITRGLFNKLTGVVSYQQGAAYAFESFKCTQFLRLLHTGVGVHQNLNCDDCATAVTTFANIVGCQLWQSGLGEYFSTHPIVLIGEQDFDCTGFVYHTLAWKGACDENEDVFDACLQFDADLKPPQVAVQPTDLRFGNTQEGYKYLTIRNPHVTPLPNDHDYGRRRRKPGTGYLADEGIRNPERLVRLKIIFNFDSWPRVEGPPGIPDRNLGAFFQETLADWSFHSGEHFQDERFPNVFSGLFVRPDLAPGELLAVTLYESRNPNLNLLEILGRFERPVFGRVPTESIGNFAFVSDSGATVVFRRNRFLSVVRSAGRKELPVIDVARNVDLYLR